MSRRIPQSVIKFLRREDGPTAVEYAVMLALIIVVVIGSVTALGGNAANTFGSVFESTGLSQFAGDTFTDQFGATMAFNSDGTATMNGGGDVRSFTQTGGNSYSFSGSAGGDTGTLTVNSSTSMTITESGGGSFSYSR